MLQNTCSVCGEKFEDHYFDKEQTKCILHCEKNDLWGNENKYYPLFLELFAEFIQNDTFKKLKINDEISDANFFIKDGYILFIYVVFPNYNDFLLMLEFAGNKKILFEKCTFFTNRFSKYEKFERMVFRDCFFYKRNSRKESYVVTDNVYFNNSTINFLTYSGQNQPMNLNIRDSNFTIICVQGSSLALKNTRISEDLMIADLRDEKENFNQVVIDKNCFIKHISLLNRLLS